MAHKLVIKPNAGMAGFLLEDSSSVVKLHNEQIIGKIRENEKEYRELRSKNGHKLKGASRLTREGIDLKYQA